MCECHNFKPYFTSINWAHNSASKNKEILPLLEGRLDHFISSCVTYRVFISVYPENKDTLKHVGLKLSHRLQRWPNIKPTLFQCVVFAG